MSKYLASLSLWSHSVIVSVGSLLRTSFGEACQQRQSRSLLGVSFFFSQVRKTSQSRFVSVWNRWHHRGTQLRPLCRPTSRVTGWFCEKSRTKCSKKHILWNSLHSCFCKKTRKIFVIKICPKGKNSPNLVTLARTKHARALLRMVGRKVTRCFFFNRPKYCKTYNVSKIYRTFCFKM
jgi:hypothetical protein